MTWTTRPRFEFGDLAAVRHGAGPPVLLLHGVGLRAEAWGAQLDGLSPRFSIVAPDMPGHGNSVFKGNLPLLRDYTDRVAAAMDGPMHVAGHSMGAMIALDLACRYPTLVRSVAALNAIYRRAPQARDAVRARATALPADQLSDPTPTLHRWFTDLNNAAARACHDWLTTVSPAGYKSAYTVFAAEDGPSDSCLRDLTCRAVFMTGAEELNSTPEMSERMAKLTPDGQCALIAGAAHMLSLIHI